MRMRVDVSGTRDGQPWPSRGSVIELPDDEGAEYCRSGMAEPVTTFTAVETTVLSPVAEELRTTTESGSALRRGRPR